MTGAATVTLGMPAYRGEAFIAESLASILAQTHPDWQVLISVDGADPATEDACRPFLDDARIRLVVQPERLGWVGNINWLVSQADTPYWCYAPQDDLLEPQALELLLACAREHPDAAVVYGDLQIFGTLDQLVVQYSADGSVTARQLKLLYDQHAAIAFHGLCRLRALRDAGRIRSNAIVEDFASDTVWMSSMARAGELIRVPHTLYLKRFHADNTHTKWAQWPADRRVLAWTVHCADMLDEAMLVQATVDERRLMYDAVLHRLTTARAAPEYLPDSARTEQGRRQLLAGFFGHLDLYARRDLPELLGTDWTGLARVTRRWRRAYEIRV